MENPFEVTTETFTVTGIETLAPFLWVVMLVAFVVWILFSSVLVYHWVQYGYKSFSVTFVLVVYFSGSVLLLSSALVALFFI